MEPLRELRDLILRHGDAPFATPDGLLRFNIVKAASPEPVHLLYEPVFGLLVQGEKRIVLGDKVFTRRAGHKRAHGSPPGQDARLLRAGAGAS